MIPNDLGLEQAKRSEPFLVVTCEERNSSTKAEREKNYEKRGERRREKERGFMPEIKDKASYGLSQVLLRPR